MIWKKKLILNKNKPFKINKNVFKLIKRKLATKRRCENDVERYCNAFGELVHKTLIIWQANNAHVSTEPALCDVSAVTATINRKRK